MTEQLANRPDDPRWRDADGTPIDEDHRGLVYDIGTLRRPSRRVRAVRRSRRHHPASPRCGVRRDESTTSDSSSSSSSMPLVRRATRRGLTEVPEETAGPFPGDGSNGVHVLTTPASSAATSARASARRRRPPQGVPLTVTLTVVDAATGSRRWPAPRSTCGTATATATTRCTPRASTNENYLRGVQAADANGTVTFTTIFPACYSGRWPHIHFEVYPSVATPRERPDRQDLADRAARGDLRPVYATTGYEQSVRTWRRSPSRSDNVFGDDGGVHQIASMSGSASGGYAAALTIGV